MRDSKRDTDVQNSRLDSLVGGCFGRMALKHIYYPIRNESPVQVRCRIQEAWSWCTGITQRDGMGREVGVGFRMGNTCTPVADACLCMAKPIQYCKVKKKIIIIINKFKKKNFASIYFLQMPFIRLRKLRSVLGLLSVVS